MARRPPLVMLPGVAVDQRLFTPQRRAFPDLHVPAWLTPDANEDLPAYARRFAQQFAAAPPMVLGGISFGGMVAAEMARVLQPGALLLIASTPTPFGLPPWSRWFRHVPENLPRAFFGAFRRSAARAIARRNRLGPADARVLHEMVFDADLGLLRWSLGAITTWPAPDNRSPITCPIFQIHGGRDVLLPLARQTPTAVIPEAGHMLNMTHAESVNRFIRHVVHRGD